MSFTDPSIYGQQPYGSYGNMMQGQGNSAFGGYGNQNTMPPMNLMQGMMGSGYQSPQQLHTNQQYGMSSLTQGIPNMLASFGMLGNQGGINNIGKQANQSANMANALVNPGNPLYQQIYGQQKKQDIANAAQEASMLQGQNRMNAAMGRMPLFSAGRGGEQAFRGLEQAYQNSDTLAQQQARGVLSQGLQGANSSLNANMLANRAQQQQTGNMLGGFNTLADLFKGLGGI